jgi:SAM-dependent methyltransferase
MANDAIQIHEAVRSRYGRLALEIQSKESVSCCDGVTNMCCAESSDLYVEDTGWLPDTVSGLSLGCGDPLAISRLEPGQVVLDLGSGGGIDCFMAARKVGPGGHVIGVDMTPEMIDRANENKKKVGLANVSFRLGQIEALPVEAESIDVIISNCVINLSPDKEKVFREAFRVLKPGGSLAVSDMVTIGRFSAEERADLVAWSACISGAEDVAGYVTAVQAAGFTAISVREKGQPESELAAANQEDGSPRLFSAQITAVKPASPPENQP